MRAEFCFHLELCGLPLFEWSDDPFQRRLMITAGLDDVAEMVNVLLEAEDVAEMSDDKASSGNGVYVNDVGVQTNGTSECSAF